MRKLFALVLTVVIASSLLLTACSSEPEVTYTAENPLELNFSYTQPAMSGVARVMLIAWADDLEAASGGRIDIIHHAGATLVAGPQMLDAAISGMCDIACISPGEIGRLPRCEIMNTPFIFPNTEIAAIAYHDYVNQYCADNELKDVKILFCVPMSAQQYIGNKPVEKLEDFNGLKLRTGGKWDSATMEALGATAVVMSTSDVHSALDTGLVDGTFFAFEGALALGFSKFTKYRTQCGVFQSVFPVVMNKDVYESLPSDLKKIIDDFSTLETSRKYGGAWMAAEPGDKARLEAEDKEAGKPPIYVVPESELDRWRAAEAQVGQDWVADLEAQGINGQELYDGIFEIVKKYYP